MGKKRKKKSRMRGSKTHGGGSMKNRRGSGNRGGRGRAGSGKRGDAKKPSYWKEPAKKGFTPVNPDDYESINLDHLSNIADSLVEEGAAEKKGDVYKIDLSEVGIEKVLGSGFPNKKLEIVVEKASSKAVKKVEDAGGEVTVENGSDTE